MARKVHRVMGMIACHPGPKTLLITEEDFVELVANLLSDFDELDRMAFKMAAARNLGAGGAEDNLDRWEKIFCQRLRRYMELERYFPVYDFDVELAQTYVEDYLETYRFTYRTIDYNVQYLHDGRDEILNIILLKKQSLTDRVLSRYGKEYGELNILRSEIRRLKGWSLEFTIEAGCCIYAFGEKGVRQLQ